MEPKYPIIYIVIKTNTKLQDKHYQDNIPLHCI